MAQHDQTHAGLDATVNYSDGKWHHYVATYDGATQTVYFDGVNVASGSVAGGPINGNALEVDIGRFGAFGAYFTGTIDDVRIYNRALSAAEVQQLYKLGTVLVKPN